MASVNNVNRSARLKCACGWACARSPGTSVQRRTKFYLNCVNYSLPGAKFCEVFVWEQDLEDYVNRRFTSAVEPAEYHKQQSDKMKTEYLDSVEELGDAEHKIGKLERENKILRFALAASAPVAATIGATIAMAAAWVSKRLTCNIAC